jgi:hypothetical protein
VDAADIAGVDAAMSLTRHRQNPVSAMANGLLGIVKNVSSTSSSASRPVPASRELAALNARVKCASCLRDSSSRGEPGRDRLQLGAPDMR